tara:strand:- start:734 stop:1180 length:447 start_codon:yes stop_codon:yes gene_type:complete
MKKIILTLILAVMAFPAMAQEHSQDHDSWLKPVEAQFVCMVNNQSYDTPQIAVEVEGKTYFGCCPMCKAKLEKVSALRAATDPVSGKSVDKAEAVIGAGPDKTVYYFESEENLHTYASGPMPEMSENGSGSSMKGMMAEEGGHNHEQP